MTNQSLSRRGGGAPDRNRKFLQASELWRLQHGCHRVIDGRWKAFYCFVLFFKVPPLFIKTVSTVSLCYASLVDVSLSTRGV